MLPYHGMFDAEVDALLVWVDTDLDRVVDASGHASGKELIQSTRPYLLTGTSTLRSLAEVGRIFTQSQTKRATPVGSVGR